MKAGRNAKVFAFFYVRPADVIARFCVSEYVYSLLTRHRKRIARTPVTKQPIFSVFSFFSLSLPSTLSPTTNVTVSPLRSAPIARSFSFVCHISLVPAFIQSHSRSLIKIFLRLPGYFFFLLPRATPCTLPSTRLALPPFGVLSLLLFSRTRSGAKCDLNARKSGR